MTRDEEVAALAEDLRRAREGYYNLTPTMSDQEYDAKKARLTELAPDDPEVKAVGVEPPKHTVWDKIDHKIPMGSLNKVNDPEELREWAIKTGESDFLITHKIDGFSMELVYEQGKLVRCVTRGDGRTGEDVTSNVSKIPSIPSTIPITEEVTVRGEVVLFKAVFDEKYAGEYANPRNTAVGRVRDKSGDGCEFLSFLAFTLESPSAPKSEGKRFRALQKMGFQVPDHLVGSISDVIDWHLKTGSERPLIEYEIDGTVVRIDDIRAQEELGDHNMRPRGQMAFKFDPAMGITKVIDVKWQVGPTGRITPVAVVEPVDVGGVTITNISLHNIAMFRELGLTHGCEVLISRRNDVIPYVERNLTAEKEKAPT